MSNLHDLPSKIDLPAKLWPFHVQQQFRNHVLQQVSKKSINPEKVQGLTIRPALPWLVMMLPSSQPGPIHSRTTSQLPHPPTRFPRRQSGCCWSQDHDGFVDAQGIGQRCTGWLLARQKQKAFLHWKTNLRQETICICTNGASWSFIKKRQMPNWK